jgi:broad specificity phosphatase PhoE
VKPDGRNRAALGYEPMRKRTRLFAAMLTALTLLVAPVHISPAAHAADHHTIVLTLVRHAQSEANAARVIDTAVPGPNITPLGYGQAADAANQLSVNRYDGIYASTMVRTQETAAPLSQALDEPVTVLPGLREIEAGQNEGVPEEAAPDAFAAPTAWLRGDRSARIPGSVNGNEFESRFNDAVKTIYDSGETNPVAFSHGLAIMAWVLMTVKNPDLALATDPLPNTAHVVVTGNPTDGWTLANWNGRSVPASNPR